MSTLQIRQGLLNLECSSKIGVAALVVFAILALVAIVELTTPDSSGVTIDGRSAIIHEGGKLVLIQGSGKTRHVWKISKDGDEVWLECTSMCADKHVKLCGIGCTIEPNLGLSFTEIKVTQLNEDELRVQWSWPISHH